MLTGVSERLGVRDAFTEGRDEAAWLRWFYTVARQRAAEHGIDMPDFAEFWKNGILRLPPAAK
jgi:biotin/methionine sulfoxide reductase